MYLYISRGELLFLFNFQPLLKYMVPLFTVYFAEYFINQALVRMFCICLCRFMPMYYLSLYTIGACLSCDIIKKLSIQSYSKAGSLWFDSGTMFYHSIFISWTQLPRIIMFIWWIIVAFLFCNHQLKMNSQLAHPYPK